MVLLFVIVGRLMMILSVRKFWLVLVIDLVGLFCLFGCLRWFLM